MEAAPPRIPLSLVDWHSDQAKFDEGPYVATVLGLDWLISNVLMTSAIRDFTDYRSVAGQIKKLENRLGIELSAAKERLRELENFKMRPFTYLSNDLSHIRDAFADVWSEPIVHILTTFRPYDTLIKKREADGTFSLDHQQWFRFRNRKGQDATDGKVAQEYRQFLNRVSTRSDNPISERGFSAPADALNEFKSGNLAFNVAFQRAFFLGYLEYSKIENADIDALVAGWDEEAFPDFGELEAPDDDYSESLVSAEEELAESTPPTKQAILKGQYSDRAKEFVAAVNRVLDVFPEFLDLEAEYEDQHGQVLEFWAGTLLRKPEDTIDFTQAASKRAQDLVFLTASMVFYDNATEPDSKSDFDLFWITCTQNSDSPITQLIRRGIKRYASGETCAAARAVRGRGDEFSTAIGEQEVYGRMWFMWTRLGL